MNKPKRYLELVQNVYTGDKFREYIISKSRAEDEDVEDWKRAIQEPIAPPPPMKGSLFIDPDDISTFSESFSLEEAIEHPDHPRFDCVEIVLKNREAYTAAMTLKEFLDAKDKFYKEEMDGMA